LFSPEDDEMMNAKTGNWFNENPQRGRSNNSVKLIRDETTRDQFMRIFNKQKEFGEPAFLFASTPDVGVNPCCEISFAPYLPVGHVMETGEVLTERKSGYQMCNLTTINGEKLKTLEDFMLAVKSATIIGTCQAGYTDFKYLNPVSRELCNREALLGVSITGMMDSPDIALNPEYQKRMAEYAIEVNRDISGRIGINPSARITCVKPEGSTSILLNTASGIHPRYAKRYFRRIQATKTDPVYQYFKQNNPHCCEESVWSSNKSDDVITFCVESPIGAITKDDISAIEFLDIIKSTQENWVITGTAIPEMSPNLTHNTSNTISVKEHEWDEVAEYIYEHRDYFTGVSMLPDTGGIYKQAPHEQIRSRDDEVIWSNLMESYQRVDYTDLCEDDDNTIHKDIVACAGGTCDLK